MYVIIDVLQDIARLGDHSTEYFLVVRVCVIKLARHLAQDTRHLLQTVLVSNSALHYFQLLSEGCYDALKALDVRGLCL